jgi:hypothetical protein
MDITYVISVIVFLGLNTDFLVVRQTAWTVFLYGGEGLSIFTGSGRAIENQIGELRYVLWELFKIGQKFGMEIVYFVGIQIVFIMCFIKFH